MDKNNSRMRLRDKMFTRTGKGCEPSSPCPGTPDTNNDLFAHDWEVFVIRHDKVSGKYKWFTMCCEAMNALTRRPLPFG